MGINTDVGQLNGMFKEVYASNVENLIPDVAIIQKTIPFNEREKIGQAYHQPVKLTASQGMTYASADSGAFALNAPVALTTKDAIVKGSQMVLRDRMSYDAAAKSSHGSTKSFIESTRYLVDSMMETSAKRVEIALLYGGSGLGNVATSANASATSTVLSFAVPEWAIGIWSGLENTVINMYTSDTTLVSSGADANFTVDTMDVDARTVTVTGSAAGITALDIAVGANGGDVNVYFLGSFGNEMSGLNKIITNTGTLFNIDAAAYNLWRGNVHSVTGALALSDIYSAVSKAVGRGLAEDVVCYVSPDTWKDLNNDLAATRSFDSSYKSSKGENGFNEIVYYGANGKISIVSHTCVKAGDAFVLPPKRLKRVGASDIRFQPYGGSNEDQFFLQLPDNAGYEIRNYTDQAVFAECPAKMVKITGFTNVV